MLPSFMVPSLTCSRQPLVAGDLLAAQRNEVPVEIIVYPATWVNRIKGAIALFTALLEARDRPYSSYFGHKRPGTVGIPGPQKKFHNRP
jgi:hypothetical protein